MYLHAKHLADSTHCPRLLHSNVFNLMLWVCGEDAAGRVSTGPRGVYSRDFGYQTQKEAAIFTLLKI
jgi:hypothetical protein